MTLLWLKTPVLLNSRYRSSEVSAAYLVQNIKKILEFLSIRDPAKIPGAHLSYNAVKNNDDNFFSKIRKMKTKLNIWQTRDLTIFGKSVLAKTLGASRLIYTTSLMTVPYAVTRVAQSLLFSFLWKYKKDKIKRNVVCQPPENGGLNFINFEIMVKSLRLAWIARLISNSNDNWKAIPNFYFDKYVGLPFLLKCNYKYYNFWQQCTFILPWVIRLFPRTNEILRIR